MEISFTWSEPEVAQEVVKAWIEIYMEERTQALGRKSLYAFYEAQTADSAAQIKSYKAQILKHLNEIGASSIEDRLQDLSERINVLRGERFNSIRLIASSDSALESTRQQLKGLPREIVTVRQIALNPAQQDLRRLLNQKRLERADMMRTYTGRRAAGEGPGRLDPCPGRRKSRTKAPPCRVPRTARRTP
ncbi:protein PslE [Pseudomonas aeruginosa]|nr:protein PslE [Pseudomonas aeruginosa]